MSVTEQLRLKPRKTNDADTEERVEGFEWTEEAAADDLDASDDSDQTLRGTLVRRMAARRTIEDYLAERALARELNDVLS